MISLILCGWTLTKYIQPAELITLRIKDNQRNEKQERWVDMTNIEGIKK